MGCFTSDAKAELSTSSSLQKVHTINRIYNSKIFTTATTILRSRNNTELRRPDYSEWVFTG